MTSKWVANACLLQQFDILNKVEGLTHFPVTVRSKNVEQNFFIANKTQICNYIKIAKSIFLPPLPPQSHKYYFEQGKLLPMPQVFEAWIDMVQVLKSVQAA